jgi:DNA-binding transcriptional MocR family regulator
LWPSERLQRCVTDAVRLHPLDAFDYQMVPGYAPLREQIAIHGLASETRMRPDRIIVTCGCQESIYLALEALTSPGDTVAVESPVYFSVLDILARFRLKVLEIPCTPPDGMHLETLAFALDHYTVSAVLTIANFHNPTGCLMPDGKKKELVRMLAARGVPLIEDDVYGDLSYGEDGGLRGRERPRSCKSFDSAGNVLYCSSFSKTVSPGLRVGWIEAGKAHDRVEQAKSLINLGASSLAQVSASLFLKDGNFPRYLRQLRLRLAANMRDLRESVLRYFPEGTTVSDPSGGLVVWVEMPGNTSSMDLYRKALERNIMIAPGRVFSLCSRFENRFRLNAGVWEPVTDAVIRELAGIADSLASGTPRAAEGESARVGLASTGTA